METLVRRRLSEALGLIIYENIAYLASDEKRDAAFDASQKENRLEADQNPGNV